MTPKILKQKEEKVVWCNFSTSLKKNKKEGEKKENSYFYDLLAVQWWISGVYTATGGAFTIFE